MTTNLLQFAHLTPPVKWCNFCPEDEPVLIPIHAAHCSDLQCAGAYWLDQHDGNQECSDEYCLVCYPGNFKNGAF
jgi:hypothetical protein